MREVKKKSNGMIIEETEKHQARLNQLDQSLDIPSLIGKHPGTDRYQVNFNHHLDHYLDIQSLIEKHPQFTEPQLRWFVVRKSELGLESSIKRLGRRLYFHVPSFLAWIDTQEA